MGEGMVEGKEPREHFERASDEGFLSLVETSSGRVVLDQDLGHEMLWSVAFAPNGEQLSAASDEGFLSLVEARCHEIRG